MNELLNQSAHEMAVIVEKAREYINDAKADNTKRAYRSDWQDFKQWWDSRQSIDITWVFRGFQTLRAYWS